MKGAYERRLWKVLKKGAYERRLWKVLKKGALKGAYERRSLLNKREKNVKYEYIVLYIRSNFRIKICVSAAEW